MSVRADLTPNRPERETVEYAAMMRRMVAAYGRRVAGADPEDLADLLALREVIEEAVSVAVAGQRAGGFSWGQIARGLGISRQAAHERFAARAAHVA